MPIEKAVKQGTIGKFRTHEKDTGSPEVQIALLTGRIEALSEHFKAHGKDFNSRVGLVKMINLRRKLLNYLKFNGIERYRAVIEKLGLRK
jgi:small subunit ribosomal protein S15